MIVKVLLKLMLFSADHALLVFLFIFESGLIEFEFLVHSYSTSANKFTEIMVHLLYV